MVSPIHNFFRVNFMKKKIANTLTTINMLMLSKPKKVKLSKQLEKESKQETKIEPLSKISLRFYSFKP